MSGTQLILMGLVVITTWGAWVEATAYPGYRVTLGRLLLALAVPLLWAGIIVWGPGWFGVLAGMVPRGWFAGGLARLVWQGVFYVVGMALMVMGPVSFVMTVVMWVSGALTGDLLAGVRGWLWRREQRRMKGE